MKVIPTMGIVSCAIRRLKLGLFLLLLSFVTNLAGARAAAVSTLTVKRDQTRLYTQQEERSEILSELKMGDKLTPLANALGNEAWYLVRTEKGLTGWIRAGDVEGTEELQKVVQESDKIPSGLSIPNETASDQPRFDKETSVPIEMTGALIIVPVEINRSVKTHMMLDTGATLTMVSTALAKKLGLVAGQKISILTGNGQITSSLSRLGLLKVGNAEAPALTVAIHDFAPHPRTEGILGLNFLSRFHTSIDSKKQVLTLAPR